MVMRHFTSAWLNLSAFVAYVQAWRWALLQRRVERVRASYLRWLARSEGRAPGGER